jgi:hypothetical protein
MTSLESVRIDSQIELISLTGDEVLLICDRIP